MTHPALLRLAFLHLAPIPGRSEANRAALERGIEQAAKAGADWILTPECGVCGFTFAGTAGTDWIRPQPDDWMARLAERVARLKVAVFLSHPEREPGTDRLFNSLFVIGPDGRLLGRHRKINALKSGSEAWSTGGTRAEPVTVPPIGPVSLLVCADAYTPGICTALRDRGARLLVSAAAWAPGFHGPEGVWENATRLTGLPLFVCNRTGADEILDFSKAESVIACNGRRIYSFQSGHPALLRVDWNPLEPDRLQGEPVAKPLV